MIRRWDAWTNQSIETRFCNSFASALDHAPQHGCIVENKKSIPFCRMEHLRIEVANIESDMGGEDLNSVMGREEEVEYPKYHPGALTISRPLENLSTPLNRSAFHYISDVLSAVTIEQKWLPCVETWNGTTMFLTRYEYVNLYHTMTDFFNAFFSYPKKNSTEDSDEPVNIVFLDAHAKGKLDSVWRQVFGNFTFVKHLPRGGVCFQRATFVPPGYVSPLFPKSDRRDCPNPVVMEDFSNHFLTSFGLEHVQMQRGKIVIIDRVPYVSHPRSNPNRAQRILSNMTRILTHLQLLSNAQSVSLVRFEELTFKEQMQAVREAHILIGNHGAGLTHMVFMSDGSHVVEFDAKAQYFTFLSRWKPNVGHHVIRSVSGGLSDDYIKEELVPTIQTILQYNSS